MSAWHWLTKDGTYYTRSFVVRVLIKAGILFILLNVFFALLNPMTFIGNLAIYNGLVPGRERLPYGEDDRAYNLSLNNLDAMFASHVVTQPKTDDEFRVMLLGDSAMWGILLKPEDTLAGYLNAGDYQIGNGRTIKAYNLGHPIMSLTKDLLLLDYAMRYEPDMVIWLTTLQSFPRDKQLFPPIVNNNADTIRRLIASHQLDLNAQDEQLVERDFLGRMIIGQRRELVDWLRLQAFGIMWSTTGIDQFYPENYTLRSADFEEDLSWGDNYAEPTTLATDDLAFDVIAAGQTILGDIPLLIINEPIFISDGENSVLRYNFWYPRWAYDNYRELYTTQAEQGGWQYLDLWDVITPKEFTDSPVHLTPAGSQQLSMIIAEEIMAVINEK